MKFLKGLRYVILSISEEITFWNGHLIYVIRNVSFTFDFKKLLENALRFVTDVLLNILPCSCGRTHDAGGVTWIAFKYEPTGFPINVFKNDFSVHYFVFVYS